MQEKMQDGSNIETLESDRVISASGEKRRRCSDCSSISSSNSVKVELFEDDNLLVDRGHPKKPQESRIDVCSVECSPDINHGEVHVQAQDSNDRQPDSSTDPESLPGSNSANFSCPHCKFTSRFARDLYQHVRSHVNLKIPNCPLCEAKFDDIESLVRHMLVHKEKTFRCIYCNRVFPKFGVMKIHMATHKNEADFKCEKCNFKTHTRRNLKAHTKRAHSTEYKCTQCEYKTGTLERLNAHLPVHYNEMRYACAFCDFKAKWENSLKRHVTAHHSTGDAYPCPLCDKKFSALYLLKTHAEKHSLPPPDFLKLT